MNGLFIRSENVGGGTFGTSIFLIGMYRFGMSERALRTVRSRASAINPENTPYPSAQSIKEQTIAT